MHVNSYTDVEVDWVHSKTHTKFHNSQFWIVINILAMLIPPPSHRMGGQHSTLRAYVDIYTWFRYCWNQKQTFIKPLRLVYSIVLHTCSYFPRQYYSANLHALLFLFMTSHVLSFSLLSQKGFTALSLASQNGRTKVVVLLLQKGASVHAVTKVH